MDYRNKYIKYKRKYIKLKTENQSGGKTIILKIPAGEGNNITITYNATYLDNTTKFYTLIKDFSIKYNDTDINLLYRSFIINTQFFIKKLFNKSEDKEDKLRNLGLRSANKYLFENCEKNKLAENNYEIGYNKNGEKLKEGKPNNHKDAKIFIESYYRKNICIHIQNSVLQKSEISYYHNIIKLYIELAIIHNYNKIELYKHIELTTVGADIEKINKKYFEIYKNIPKYIESNIDLNKIDLFINDEKKDITNKKIIFDSGNSGTTLIKKTMLKYLGIYREDGTIEPKYNNIVFQNFIKINSVGVNDKEGDHINPIKSNLIMINFKFTDKKLNNDKTYIIFCFETDTLPVDILLGQDTMQQLYEDGYSIKWKKTDEFDDKNLYIKSYNNLESNFSTIIETDYNRLTNIQKLEIFKSTNNFLNGKYFEIIGMTPDRINLFKEKLGIFYKKLKKNKRDLDDFFDKFYIEFGFNDRQAAIDLIINDIFA